MWFRRCSRSRIPNMLGKTFLVYEPSESEKDELKWAELQNNVKCISLGKIWWRMSWRRWPIIGNYWMDWMHFKSQNIPNRIVEWDWPASPYSDQIIFRPSTVKALSLKPRNNCSPETSLRSFNLPPGFAQPNPKHPYPYPFCGAQKSSPNSHIWYYLT